MTSQSPSIQIEIDQKTFERLIKSGDLFAQDFRCLNGQSKRLTQQFWLEALGKSLSQSIAMI